LTKKFTLFIVDTWNAADFADEFRETIDKDTFYMLPEEEKEKYASSVL
jgi:hypothetical protein